MAVIKNIIQTVFTSKGAQRVNADTEKIGRAQTRLGQESVNTSRAFAAQASGLGGLVAAYAGAAATVFALTAAFDSLARAAGAENIVKGTQALARETGQSGRQILDTIREVTQGQLSLAESATAANLALSSGFSVEQIERLAESSNKAAKALGRDLQDSFNRVVRGAAKLEPELLDELGVFVRIDDAATAYARTLGTTSNELSQFERRQAFLTAVLDQLETKFANVDITTQSAQKSLAQLRTNVENLATEFGQFIANALVPLVEFLKDGGNQLLLFSGILTLVFGKTFQLAGAGLSAAFLKLESGLDRIAIAAEDARGNIELVQKASNKLNKDIEARGGLAADGGRFNQSGVERQVAVEAARARTTFISGVAISPQKQAADVATLEKAIRQLTAAGKGNSAAVADATKIINTYKASASSATIATRILAGATNLAAGAAKVASVGFSALAATVNSLFIAVGAIQLIGTLFDVDLLTKIRNLFIDTTQATKELTEGILGLTQAASPNLVLDLAAFGVEASGIEDLIKDARQNIIDSFSAQVSDALDVANFRDLSNFETLFISIGIDPNNKDFRQQLADIAAQANNEELSIQQQLLGIEIRRADLQESINDLETSSVVFRRQSRLEQARAELRVLDALELSLERFGDRSNRVFGQLARELDLNVNQIANIFTEDQTGLIDASTNSLTSFGIALEAAGNKSLNFEDLSEDLQEIFIAGINASSALDNINRVMEAGSASAQQIDPVIGGLRQSLQLLKDTDAAGFKTQIDILGTLIDRLQEVSDILSDIETVFQGISNAFSGQLSTTTDAFFEGLINSSGELATSTAEIQANQATLLASTLEATQKSAQTLKDFNDRADLTQTFEQFSGGGNLSIANREAELYNTTLKAIVGTLIQQSVAIQDIIDAEKQKTIELQQQLALYEQEGRLQILQAESALVSTIAQNRLAAAERELELSRLLLENDEKRLRNALNRANALDALMTRRDDGSAQFTDAFATEQLESRVLPAARAMANQFMQTLAAGQRVSVLDRELKELERVFREGGNRQRAIAEFELAGQEAINKQELALFDAETKLLADRIKADIAKNSADRAIIEAQAALDIARLESQKAIIAAEASIIQAQLEGYKAFQNVVNVFAGAIEAFGVVVSAIPEAGDAQVSVERASIGNLPSIDAAVEGINTNIDLQNQILTQQSENIIRTRDLQIEQNRVERSELISQLSDLMDRRAAEREGIGLDQTNEIDSIVDRINELDTAFEGLGGAGGSAAGAADAISELQEKLLSLYDSVQGSISDALSEINDLVFYGEGNFGDILSNLFRTIQQDFFKLTIADPLSNLITEGIFSAAGVPGGRKGIENATVNALNGALLVQVVQGPEDLFNGIANDVSSGQNSLFGSVVENTNNIFSRLFGEGSFLTRLLTNIFGQGGLFANLLSGIGNLFSNIFGGIGSGGAGGGFQGILGGAIIPGLLANGGLVHMSQGGMLRDRALAALEPGEFVIRRPIARAVGTPALQQLNATGNMGSGAAPVINIINEGTPKEATASAPKFDGEKYVIDMVVRDLQNNGPIRRTIRGGAL